MHTFNISQFSSTSQFHNITKITNSRNSQMPDFIIFKIVTNSQYSQQYKLFKMHRKNKLRKTYNHPIHNITKTKKHKTVIRNNPLHLQMVNFHDYTTLSKPLISRIHATRNSLTKSKNPSMQQFTFT